MERVAGRDKGRHMHPNKMWHSEYVNVNFHDKNIRDRTDKEMSKDHEVI